MILPDPLDPSRASSARGDPRGSPGPLPCLERLGRSFEVLRDPLDREAPFEESKWGVTNRWDGEAESQWIVAARLLCHLQYLVPYLSRLQRIHLPDRLKLLCKAPEDGFFRRLGGALDTCFWGRTGDPTSSRVTTGEVESAASSMDSDLEAFSHNPTHGSFAPLAFQPSAMTNYVNQRFLSY